MKKIDSLFICVFLFFSSAFSQSAVELQSTARSFMQQGDYPNAVLVLNRALQMEPDNFEVIKDLSLSYYMQRNNAKALDVITPLLERADADDQCYQIAGNIYKQLGQPNESEKLYCRGIKKFPGSGAMYNELGELLEAQRDHTSIKQWEKGIEVDPDFPKNYYNACKYYFLTTDKIWSVLYGEIFLNMEPLSSRTTEIKNIILDRYKNLFADAVLTVPANEKNKFTDAFIATMNKQGAVAATGINPEALIMIRSRFILDWYNSYGDKIPFKLFELHRQLLQEGLFDAYNQWLFGSVSNLSVYQNWTNKHADEYNEFTRFQRGRVFKIPAGQYYK